MGVFLIDCTTLFTIHVSPVISNQHGPVESSLYIQNPEISHIEFKGIENRILFVGDQSQGLDRVRTHIKAAAKVTLITTDGLNGTGKPKTGSVVEDTVFPSCILPVSDVL